MSRCQECGNRLELPGGECAVCELVQAADYAEQQEHDEIRARQGFDPAPCWFCGGETRFRLREDIDSEYIACDCGAYYDGDDLTVWNKPLLLAPENKTTRSAH
ncbi:MAG: hypothetical protein RJQ08_13550 [Salinisphaeraceae bacterium]